MARPTMTVPALEAMVSPTARTVVLTAGAGAVGAGHLLAEAADEEQAVVGARPEQHHYEEHVGVHGDGQHVPEPRKATTPREMR